MTVTCMGRTASARTALRAPFALLLALPLATMAAPALADEITFTDQYDRTITLDGPAERLATIPIPAAAMSVAVAGSPEPLVAMHKLSKTAILNGVLGEFFPSTKDIPSDIVGDGFAPNVEALLSVAPDLVLQWGTQGTDIIAPIEAAGLKVATLRYGTEEDAAEWLAMMGTILGAEDRARDILAWRKDALASITQATAGIAAEDRPRTIYFLRYLSSLRVAGGGTYNDFWMTLGGGDNVAGDLTGFKDVDPEQILAWDPEVIFLNGFEDDLSPQDVYDNPVFASLSAVKNKRVYKLPIGGYRWDPPNQESPLTWQWVAMMLHPETFDFPLRAEIAEHYGMLYGVTPTDDQIDAILRTAMNGGGADYGRLAR